MGQFAASQTVASQTLPAPIIADALFEAALYDPNAAFNVVVELQAFAKQALQPTFGYMANQTFADQVVPADPNAVAPALPSAVLLRFSSRALNWRWDDELAPNGFAEVRLSTRSNVESSVNVSATTEAGGVLNVGSILVDDGDRFIGPYVKDYSLIGRQARILWGLADGPRKQYKQLITAHVLKVERNKYGKFIVSLQDQRFRLDVPFQTNIFNGVGTLPGTVEQFGTRKPRLIGYRRHIEPPVIDTGTGLRMINDGPINGVLSGYFGGHPAVNAGDFPSLGALYSQVLVEGSFATCNALGVVWPLPAAGYTGPFTVEAQGDSSFGYTESAGQLIINEMLRSGVQAFEINQNAFSFMDESAGYWYDGSSEVTKRQVIEQLALSAGGRIASDLQFTAIRLTPPNLLAFEEEFMDEEVEELQFQGTIGNPVVTFRMYYGKNDRVLSADEIVLPEQFGPLKEDLQKEFFISELSNPLTVYRYISRDTLVEKESLLNDSNGVATVLVALRDFFSVERQLWSCKLPVRALRRSVGAILRINSKREPTFASGANCILVANNRQLEGMYSMVHFIL